LEFLHQILHRKTLLTKHLREEVIRGVKVASVVSFAGGEKDVIIIFCQLKL